MSVFEILFILVISLGTVIWGVNIYNQKGIWFLAGWNTMRKEKRKPTMKKSYAICMEDVLFFAELVSSFCCTAALIIMMLFYVLASE